MALRIKLRREFKIALEEDGYSQEEIKEQLDHLIDEEIERQDKERQYEIERQERERQSQQEIERERSNNEREKEKQEFELRKLELENNINERCNEEQSESSSNYGKYEDMILAYDDSTVGRRRMFTSWSMCFLARHEIGHMIFSRIQAM